MTSIRPDGRIEFRFYRPGATEVKVVGTFNKWDVCATPMQQLDGAEGWWIAEADIAAGEHSFRYVADGHWFTDFAANGVERNKYGWNSILIVPERPMRIGTAKVAADNADDQDGGASFAVAA